MSYEAIIHHQYSYGRVHDQVSALNRQIARLDSYARRATHAHAVRVKYDRARLIEVRDIFLQIEHQAGEDDGAPSWPEQIARRLHQS